MKTYYITGLGCKVNSYEVAAVGSLLEKEGYAVADKNADVALINTCGVTRESERKSRQYLRRIIKNNPHAVVIVFGCASSVNGAFFARIPGVSIVMGTTNHEQIPLLIQRYHKEQKTLIVGNVESKIDYEEMKVTHYTHHTRAYVKIQDGCDEFCTFCIIPYARGRMRSRKKDDILDEIGHLIGAGYQEIVLTGIHTGGYGRDLPDYKFDQLVQDILTSFPNLFRLRISSIELNEVSDTLLELIRDDQRMARHLHIPLQSGSNAILRKMNRHYTQEKFIARCRQIKEVVPDIALTTDVIVGFPTETIDDFNTTRDLITTIGFAKLHVFPYALRPGTKAAEYSETVDASSKKARVSELIQLSSQLEKKFLDNLVGQKLTMIIEHPTSNEFEYTGITTYYARGYMTSITPLKKGDIVEFYFKTAENQTF